MLKEKSQSSILVEKTTFHQKQVMNLEIIEFILTSK